MIRNPAKALLRTQIKKTVSELSLEARDAQSKVILEKVLALPAFKSANRISVYLSTANEVNTIPIIEQMWQQEKQVFVPTYDGKNMEMVELHSMADYESLPLTKWHIKQPVLGEKGRKNALETGGLDLILLPGVAFTADGGRCGQGMGYYDRFLKRLFATPDISRDAVTLVGLAFHEQMVADDELPMDDHDFLLDQVITSD